ncbi:MAG: hypothetical protein M4D80_40555 [Myxococcota bacterium]|nr:hypothetical protein [Myxococcota bacterium]
MAIDESGNPVVLPPEAAFWRVRRDTGGRPRIVNGPDFKPLTLPIDYPPEDLLNLVGRGSYRLDLCDETGQHLETVTLKLGPAEPELRNRAPADTDEPTFSTAMLPATGSDVRLVLEANVRATQLAFLHNERTLAASLRMAETLRDGVHVLAESQADWIKSLATSRGFFRNASPPSSPKREQVPGDERDDIDDDSEDAEDVEANESKNWVDLLTPAVKQLAETASTLIIAKASQMGLGGAPPSLAQLSSDAGTSSASHDHDDDLAARGFEARELMDMKYAARKGQAKRAARAAKEVRSDADRQVRSRAELQARIMSDPVLLQHLMQINAKLLPEETAMIMELVTNSAVERQEEFLASVKRASIAEAVGGIRDLIAQAVGRPSTTTAESIMPSDTTADEASP